MKLFAQLFHSFEDIIPNVRMQESTLCEVGISSSRMGKRGKVSNDSYSTDSVLEVSYSTLIYRTVF